MKPTKARKALRRRVRIRARFSNFGAAHSSRLRLIDKKDNGDWFTAIIFTPRITCYDDLNKVWNKKVTHKGRKFTLTSVTTEGDQIIGIFSLVRPETKIGFMCDL
jgi:hypothetical protein